MNYGGVSRPHLHAPVDPAQRAAAVKCLVKLLRKANKRKYCGISNSWLSCAFRIGSSRGPSVPVDSSCMVALLCVVIACMFCCQACCLSATWGYHIAAIVLYILCLCMEALLFERLVPLAKGMAGPCKIAIQTGLGCLEHI